MVTSSGAVWKYSLPPAATLPVESSAKPCAMSAPFTPASASSRRLVWRPLRATSVMPFLWPSSSSSTIIGRKMSCSSKRNSAVGSCSSTLVSSTNSRVGPVALALRARAAAFWGAGFSATRSAGRAGAGASVRATGLRAPGTGSGVTTSSTDSVSKRACCAGARLRLAGVAVAVAVERAVARRVDRSMTSEDSLAPRLVGGGGRGMRIGRFSGGRTARPRCGWRRPKKKPPCQPRRLSREKSVDTAATTFRLIMHEHGGSHRQAFRRLFSAPSRPSALPRHGRAPSGRATPAPGCRRR